MNPGVAPIRILINAIHAHSGGGITYLRNLLPQLVRDPQLDIHVIFHEDQLGRLQLPRGGVTQHARNFANGFVSRLIWEQLRLPSIARGLGADVVYSPANFGPLFVPASVILLRNALAVGDDEQRLLKRFYWLVLGFVTRLSIRRSCGVIAVSSYAREALTLGMGENVRDRVRVVHHGISPDFSPPPNSRVREDFLLCVGDLYLQKNMHGLLPALARLRKDFPDIRLKVAGRKIDGAYAGRVIAQARQLGLDNNVEWLGHVGTADLIDLYQRCRLFIFPSLAETFGNPLIEAMACGAPVVCSNTTAMPEIAGMAALYFDPYDSASIAQCISEILSESDRLSELSRRSLDRAADFSWTSTAKETAEILKEAVSRG
jgi:glycosyltransferase involved in cell wall biosynthesis